MTTLFIHGWGAITPVGLRAETTCAAIRARISRYEDVTAPLPPREAQVGARVPAARKLKRTPSDWLVNLACHALAECLEHVEADPGSIVVSLAPPEPLRGHPGTQGLEGAAFLTAMQAKLGRSFHPRSRVLDGGPAAIVPAIDDARALLEDPTVQLCAVGGVDSLVNEVDLARLSKAGRLRGGRNPQGLVPAEGASFVLLGARAHGELHPPLGRILGLGIGHEPNAVLGSSYSVGLGMRSALLDAASQSGGEPLIDFVVSTFNGERYGAWEAMICRPRVYRTRRELLEHVHPAMSVGDIGTAAAALAIIVAAMAVGRGYGPGQRAMCEIASDEGLRAACVVGPPPISPAFVAPGVRAGDRGHPFSRRLLLDDEIRWDVVEEHLDELEFLLEQWQKARASGQYTLADLDEGPEARLEAHLDGLMINGPPALERVVWPALEEGTEAHRVAAAALALLDAGDYRVFGILDEPKPNETHPSVEESPERDDGMPEELLVLERELLDFVAANPPEDPDEPTPHEPEDEIPPDGPKPAFAVRVDADPRLEGLALALALSTNPKLANELRTLAAQADGEALAVLLKACADRGCDPGPGLGRGLLHDDPRVQAAALAAAVFGDRSRLLATVESGLRHRAPAVRAAALDTAMMWGSHAAWEQILRTYHASEATNARLWLACLGDDRHARALVALLPVEALRGDVLWALGFSGRVPAVEASLEWLEADDETTRRLAGEVIASIVGLDLEDESLWVQDVPGESEVDGHDPSQEEDDLDADLVPRPEDELPLPIAAAIRERWATLRNAFVPGRRYLLGKPVEREGPGWALSLLPCRRVDVVAREVVARSRGLGHWPGYARASWHRQIAHALEGSRDPEISKWRTKCEEDVWRP